METLENFWQIYSNLVLTLGINSLLALSIYITLSCGMLSLANAAFMGLGAYAAAILTMNYEEPFIVALAAGIALPVIVAYFLGKATLRLSGVYLAMATLAFGEVVRIAILNAESLTGGALGLNGVPNYTQWWHVLAALVLVLAMLACMRRSKAGRALEAIKEDETAAGLMGIDTNANKMMALTVGAGIAGLAGALSAHLTFFISPNEYGFDRAVEILTMAILGGVNAIIAPVVGAVFLTLLPEVLRGLNDFRLVVNGVLLIVIILFLPRGLWDPARFRRLFGRTSGSKP